MKSLSLFLVLALVGTWAAGCATWPDFTVGESRVESMPDPPREKLEAERQAGAILARNVRPALDPLANTLSASLGLPERLPDPSLGLAVQVAAVEEALRQGQGKARADLEKFNAHLKRHEGKEIQGTGLNLALPGGGLVVAGLVVFCFLGGTPVVFFVLRRARATLRHVVQAIQDFKYEDPKAAQALKARIAQRTDRGGKILIGKMKI